MRLWLIFYLDSIKVWVLDKLEKMKKDWKIDIVNEGSLAIIILIKQNVQCLRLIKQDVVNIFLNY